MAYSGFLLVLAALVYDRYRSRRWYGRLLHVQQQDLDQKSLELEGLYLAQGRLLTEKEWLLKEMHHRVKNNLQIAMSLLNTQSFYLENEKALAAIRQSRNRMYAMSLIHQRLYQTHSLELISMSRYIPELIDFIKDNLAGDRNIRFGLHIDPVSLDVAQAVPTGLIINEAVTNCIQYAFPERNDGAVNIVLRYLGQDDILLQIADNGIGLRADFDIKRAKSMGMELIGSLNRQLEGTMNIRNRGGLVISIVFHRVAECQEALPA
jgi:two-component system, sensor histidine kinase PdtaS